MSTSVSACHFEIVFSQMKIAEQPTPIRELKSLLSIGVAFEELNCPLAINAVYMFCFGKLWKYVPMLCIGVICHPLQFQRLFETHSICQHVC